MPSRNTKSSSPTSRFSSAAGTGVLEMAQKVIGGGQSHMTLYMHNFEMAQNSNKSIVRKLNGSNFEPSQGFRTKKSEPTQGLDT